MTVWYHSAFEDAELEPGKPLSVIPMNAVIRLFADDSEPPSELFYNEAPVPPGTREIICEPEAELVVLQNGERSVYRIRSAVRQLSGENAGVYENFGSEFRALSEDVISAIQNCRLKMYAVDHMTDEYDFDETFEYLESALKAFKAICDRPKTQLRSVNEIRPIETVKRIGYEAIPYLAAHSEDWLARTAGGLKPARLFSRVEDDEYQIYENRVVKTLIDQILSFLRKTEKRMRDQRDKRLIYMKGSVQTGSFGFDVGFSRALSELIGADGENEEYNQEKLDLIKDLHERAARLLRSYRALRQTAFYRYLKKTKPVTDPLSGTNILVLDRNYSVIYRLWSFLRETVAMKPTVLTTGSSFADVRNDFQSFCATLCGYSAHILGFESLGGGFYKRHDNIGLCISHEDGLVRVRLKDETPRIVRIPPEVQLPIEAGSERFRISYDGSSLELPCDVTDAEVESFCGLFKTRESRGRLQSEEKKRYTALKRFLNDELRSYEKPKETGFLIIPAAVELDTETRDPFVTGMNEILGRWRKNDEQIVVALPICDENEQEITKYAKEDEQRISFLPLTMFDINSFRRLQNLLYREILKLGVKTCPNCGERMQKRGGRMVCDNCTLILTKTICPGCGKEYLYMSYDVSDATLMKMREVEPDSFFEWDSLYQYKDIVNMSLTPVLRPICPGCNR